jgi:hypothetical protein
MSVTSFDLSEIFPLVVTTGPTINCRILSGRRHGTAWSNIVVKRGTATQVVNKFPAFSGNRIVPYHVQKGSEPDESITHTSSHSISFKYILSAGFPSVLFPPVFHTKFLCEF